MRSRTTRDAAMDLTGRLENVPRIGNGVLQLDLHEELQFRAWVLAG